MLEIQPDIFTGSQLRGESVGTKTLLNWRGDGGNRSEI